MKTVEQEIRVLKLSVIALAVVCAGLFLKILTQKNFDEINVGRINVVEKDGKLRLVISNQARQHPGVMDGITYDERIGKRPPGVMFFNEKGDESGGLVFDGNVGKGQGGSLTFDKFRGDQTIQFLHEEEPDGTYFAGLKVNDQNTPLNDLLAREKEIDRLPTKEARAEALQNLRKARVLAAERIRIGRSTDRASVIDLKDADGKVRLQLKVEADGSAKILFFNDHGEITDAIPTRPGAGENRKSKMDL